jgi:hypothetical protein
LYQEPSHNSLSETDLEILNKVLEVLLIPKVITSREEFIDVDVMTKDKSPKVSREAKFADQTLIVVEVVHHLVRSETVEVDVVEFGCPFQVEEG